MVEELLTVIRFYLRKTNTKINILSWIVEMKVFCGRRKSLTFLQYSTSLEYLIDLFKQKTFKNWYTYFSAQNISEKNTTLMV